MGWPLGSLMVIPELKVLYCPIAKNACTSLKRAIVRASCIEMKEEVLSGCVHMMTDNHNTGIHLCEYPAEQINRILNDNEFFSFIVLRDPYERLRSAYVEKFVLNRMDGKQWAHTGPVIAAITGCDLDEVNYDVGITFREFVEYIIKQPPRNLDTHWRPQFMYMAGVPYSHMYTIGELDKLERDYEKHTGLSLGLEHKNVSAPKTNWVKRKDAVDMRSDELYAIGNVSSGSLHDETLLKLVRRYFALDYTMINLIDE